MDNTSPVYVDTTQRGFYRFFGVMVVLLLLPPCTDAALYVLLLMPLATLLIWASGLLFGRLAMLLAALLSLYLAIYGFIALLKF